MRRLFRDNIEAILFTAIVILIFLIAGSCTINSLITVNLPPKPQARTSTSQPSGSFLDRLLEDMN
jgi:hypothetical protein